MIFKNQIKYKKKSNTTTSTQQSSHHAQILFIFFFLFSQKIRDEKRFSSQPCRSRLRHENCFSPIFPLITVVHVLVFFLFSHRRLCSTQSVDAHVTFSLHLLLDINTFNLFLSFPPLTTLSPYLLSQL